MSVKINEDKKKGSFTLPLSFHAIERSLIDASNNFSIVCMSKRKGQQFVSYFSRFFLSAILPLSFHAIERSLIDASNNFSIVRMSKRKGQSSIMDAFFFLMICSAAATLMIYTAGLYGANTSRQIAMAYNFEYASNALIALHYVQDSGGNYFWRELGDKLAETDSSKTNVESYLKNEEEGVWSKLIDSSPSGKTVLMFSSGSSTFYCYEQSSIGGVKCVNSLLDISSGTVFTSSAKLDDWNVVLQLYY